MTQEQVSLHININFHFVIITLFLSSFKQPLTYDRIIQINSLLFLKLVFTALLSQCVVEAGFFYSTGYYPFGGYSHIANPYIGHTFTVPHAIPTISYSGCRNVHGALVPCALPTPLITAVGAPALVETEVPAEAAPEESGEAAPEAAAEASAETAEERY